MIKFLRALCLLFPFTLNAQDITPDRVYLNIATKHFGLGEDIFGVNGPNEINPGIGLAWDNQTKIASFSMGLYRDSFAQPAITLGVSRAIAIWDETRFVAGLSVTKSLGGTEEFLFAEGLERVEPRFYAWPYLQLEHKYMYTQLRAGVNRERELAGVFAFGLKFDIEDLQTIYE